MHDISPFLLSKDLNPLHDLVEPAMLGTLNVLNGAIKSLSVKRFVETSSVAAVYDPAMIRKRKIFTEED